MSGASAAELGWDDERITALAARLVAAPSENPDPAPDGRFEALAVDALEREALALGFAVERIPVAPDRDDLRLIAGADRPGAPLVFLGHSDVVPAGAGWTRAPFAPVVDGGRLYGRGAADMKGGLAAALAAMAALTADPEFAHPVELIVTVDEEELATGIRRYLDVAPDRELLACIVAEPTDLDVVTGCRGAANLHLEVRGRAAHAGRPSDGVSAIVAAARIVELLRAQGEAWRAEAADPDWSPTWNVGRIDGGHGTSIVADRCTLDIDRRLMPSDRSASVLETLLASIDEAGITGGGVTVSGRVDMSMPGFVTDDSEPLPCLALAAVQAAGARGSRLRRWTAACEGGFMARRFGVPTIVLGPGEVTREAHQPDESVAVADLAVAAEAYLALGRALAGHAREHDVVGSIPTVPGPRRTAGGPA